VTDFEEKIWSNRRGSGFAAVVDGVRVVRLAGSCSHEDFLELCCSIARWNGGGHRGLVIDFSAMKWHDLVGIRSLVKALVRAHEETDIHVCLVRAPLDVRVVLRYTVGRSSVGCVSTVRHGIDQIGKRALRQDRPDDRLVAVLPGDQEPDGD
jgi:hypothetical protein